MPLSAVVCATLVYVRLFASLFRHSVLSSSISNTSVFSSSKVTLLTPDVRNGVGIDAGPGVALPRAEDMTATAATATVVTAIVATATVAGYASDASGALTFACAFLFSLRLTSLSRYLSHPFSSNISALASHCATRQALPVTLSWTRHRLYPLLVARATTAAVAAIATKNDHRPVGTAPTHRTGAAGGAQDRALARTAAEGK